MVLTFDRNMKGARTPAFTEVSVNLTGDAQGEREREQLLKRLAKDLPLVVFASQRGKSLIAFGYSDGTWFQMTGDGNRWRFTHCEPYLRRTFKGTTAELVQVIEDGLAHRKEPPPPDPKAEPGLGPEVPRAPMPEKKTAVACRGPVLAVIPTFVVIGPVALLAALFPAVFGGLALFLRRWTVLLAVASLGSTLYLLHAWFQGSMQDSWWGTTQAFWTTVAVVSLAGVAWSWARYRRAAADGRIDFVKLRRGDEFCLHLLSIVCVAATLYCCRTGDNLHLLWKQGLLTLSVGVWMGSVYALYSRLTAKIRTKPPRVPAEPVMLVALAIACFGFGAAETRTPGDTVIATASDPALGEPAVKLLPTKWVFTPRDRGSITSSPLLDGDFVYVGAAHQSGFSSRGTLYCLDGRTGKVRWTFDSDGKMKPVFSSPCVAEGRVYVGEGFHQDSNCKLYCINASDGSKIWDFATQSHTESSPCVVDGRVYFGAGDDGVFCLDAVSGRRIWHFQGPHVDSSPAVVDGRVYAGSGYGDHYIFCLYARTGNVVWKTVADLPAFASPAVSGRHVFFGIGTGDMLASSDTPAGALLCVDADTGRIVWRYDARDAVHGKPAVDDRSVFFGSRDTNLYCVGRDDGQLRWQQGLGSPVVTSPALARSPRSRRNSAVYAIAHRRRGLLPGSSQRPLELENEHRKLIAGHTAARVVPHGDH